MANSQVSSAIGRASLLTRALAPFFPRYRVLVALEREPQALRAAYRNLILSHDRRLLYMRNQKCACTQVAQVLYAYANGRAYAGNIHRANRGFLPGRYRWPEIKPVLAAHAAYQFTVVRHPQARFMSAFRDFFVDARNLGRRNHLAAIRAHGFDPDRAAADNLDAFIAYVAADFARDRFNTTTHWRLQVDNIAFGQIAYDRIGKVETLLPDLQKVFAEAGIAGFDPAPWLARKANATRPLDLQPTRAQAARIADLYAPDYAAFGY